MCDLEDIGTPSMFRFEEMWNNTTTGDILVVITRQTYIYENCLFFPCFYSLLFSCTTSHDEYSSFWEEFSFKRDTNRENRDGGPMCVTDLLFPLFCRL